MVPFNQSTGLSMFECSVVDLEARFTDEFCQDLRGKWRYFVSQHIFWDICMLSKSFSGVHERLPWRSVV